jgi:hypothetical protein
MGLLDDCFDPTFDSKSKMPLEKTLRAMPIDIQLEFDDGQIVTLTNLWELYEHAFNTGYNACLYDVASGNVKVKLSENGNILVKCYSDTTPMNSEACDEL